MIRRKALKYLRNWRKEQPSKPLMLRGARQVGKSTLAKQLSKDYKQYISLNLEKTKDAKFFQGEDDVKTIFERIVLERNKAYVPGNTLLFIDEIQELPEVIALLRYFFEELPELDVIAAGSLLEFAVSEVPSFPVGRIEQYPIYPVDFEEFLEAMGEEKALDYYKQIPIPNLAHEKLLSLFNRYMIVGGMPEVVADYAVNKSIPRLRKIYSSIWDNYVNDIEKYGSNQSEIKLLRHIVATAPEILDRITFEGFGNSNYKSREVGEAFRKLDKAGLIRLLYPTYSTSLPLQSNYRRKPKIQFLDTGILNYAAGLQGELMGVTDLNTLYKGYLVNHMMIQELISRNERIGFIPPFWTRENANANAEVDMIIKVNNKVVPVEVKSGAKGRLRSLHEFMDRSELNYGVRLLANEFSVEEAKTSKDKKFQLVNMPYYAVGQMQAWLSELAPHIK